MNAVFRHRGPLAVFAHAENPQQLLAELQTSVAQFMAKHGGDVRKLERAVDDINASLAAMKVGGAAGSAPDMPASRTKALKALGKFGRTGVGSDLTEGLTVNAAMGTDSGPDGGYLVGEEISKEIMRVQRNDSVMRRLARVVTTTKSDFQQPFSKNNIASGWVGERDARPQTDGPDLALIDVPAGEVYANPAVTQRLIDDADYNLGDFIATEISDAFTAQEGSAFLTGDGIKKPRGFLTYDIVSTADATREFGKIQYKPSGGASDFASEDPADYLIDLVFSLKAKHRRNATWLMNSLTLAKIAKFKDDQDQYIYQRSLVEGTPDRLLGYPIEIDEDMPDTGSNTYPVAFGDWQRGYLITDRTGMRILRDPYTNKPYVMFYATKRVGGGLLDSNAIKVLKCATS